MEQRKYPRFPVQFRSSFSSTNLVGGEGKVLDLSVRGCRVSSSVEVLPGTALELKIHANDQGPPIHVDQAVVRWCRATQFGLEFMSLQPGDWARLQHLVKGLELEPYRRAEAEETTTA